jgi:hypothetical protein
MGWTVTGGCERNQLFDDCNHGPIKVPKETWCLCFWQLWCCWLSKALHRTLDFRSVSQTRVLIMPARYTATRFVYLIAQVALPMLIKDLETMAIPDIQGKAKTPVGSITYDLSQIHVGTVSVPTSSIAVNTGGLVVSLSSVSMSLTAHWFRVLMPELTHRHYREDSFPHISDSGSCDVSASSVSASITVAIGTFSSTISCSTWAPTHQFSHALASHLGGCS